MSQNYSMFSSHLASHLPRLARWVELLGGLATFSLNSIWPNLLCRHFARAGLRPDLYMVDWVSHLLVSSLSRFLWSLFQVMTLFSKAAPLDITCRIWDLLIRWAFGERVVCWNKIFLGMEKDSCSELPLVCSVCTRIRCWRKQILSWWLSSWPNSQKTWRVMLSLPELMG